MVVVVVFVFALALPLPLGEADAAKGGSVREGGERREKADDP